MKNSYIRLLCIDCAKDNKVLPTKRVPMQRDKKGQEFRIER